jgi:hypothetical protein
MARKEEIQILNTKVSYFTIEKEEYISLTDIARHRDAERSDYILQNWLRNRNTIDFIGLWEQFHNAGFNSIEFDGIKTLAGSNSFSLTPKRWIEATNAIGIVSKAGRYGGTFAHKDIAFEFATWLSAEFKFYLIHEFQRLKQEESKRTKVVWDVHRTLSKVNYSIQTDAIKENIIPHIVSKKLATQVYANEADLLNVALFGTTAKVWRETNPDKEGNIRDFATLEQLVVLSNLESINALFIQQGLHQAERLKQLNLVAISQMKSLVNSRSVNKLRSN